jgi:hypothetical protein
MAVLVPAAKDHKVAFNDVAFIALVYQQFDCATEFVARHNVVAVHQFSFMVMVLIGTARAVG